MRATSSMADCASFIALVVELVAAATASMFSAIWEADCAASATLRFISVVVAVCSSTAAAMTDAQAAIDEVARMATSLHSSVARFRY